MIAPDDRERLHDFLDGRLSAAERLRFERDIASQSDLRREFETLSALRSELASFRGETAPADLKDSILTALRASANAPRLPRRSNPTMFLVTSALAAGLAIGVTVLYFASLRERPPAHLAVESAAGDAARGKPVLESEELDKSLGGLRARAPGSRSKDDEAGEAGRKPGSDTGASSGSGGFGSRGLAPTDSVDRGGPPAGEADRGLAPSESEGEKTKSDEGSDTTPDPSPATPGAAAPAPANTVLEPPLAESKADTEPGRTTATRETWDATTAGSDHIRVLRVRLPRNATGRPAVEDLIRGLESEAVTRSSGLTETAGAPAHREGGSASVAKLQDALSSAAGADQAAALEAAWRAHREANPSAVLEHTADESWLSDFVRGAAAVGFEVSELMANDSTAGSGAGAIPVRGPATGGGGGGGPGGAQSKDRVGPTPPGAPLSSKAKGPATPGSAPKAGAVRGLAKGVTASDPPLPGLDPSTWRWVALATAGSEQKKDARESSKAEVGGLTGGGQSKPLGLERFVIVIVRDGD